MAQRNEKKQVPLRISAALYAQLAAWAEDEFRSINGQIEYLLTECVRRRGKNKPSKETTENEKVR
ncbi:MAG: PTS ascorbate transporter subunit IIC [Clostridiales bacterium]|nr:PTS ascorbate transporter subunit IIC [Clostridiales bacterium]